MCTRVYVFVTMSEAAPVTVTSCLIFYHFGFFAIFIAGFEVCLDLFVLHHSMCRLEFEAAL